MELQIKIIGYTLILLSLVHLVFSRYFNWKKDLSSISLINKEMMYIHTFFIGLIVFLMGLLCLSSSNELIETALGKKLSLGLAIFWLVRLITQFFGYSSVLWKGKKFETSIHIFLSLFWMYLTIVFFMIYLK